MTVAAAVGVEEDLGPACGRQVRRHHEAAALVALADEAEQEVGGTLALIGPLPWSRVSRRSLDDGSFRAVTRGPMIRELGGASPPESRTGVNDPRDWGQGAF